MFDNYIFRCHSLGKITGGVNKSLTDNQLEEYNTLLSKHKDGSKSLTLTQSLEYGKLRKKLKDPSKQLTDKQKNKLFELMMVYESRSNPLTVSQIQTLSKLIDKKNSTLHLDTAAKTELNGLAKSYILNRKGFFSSSRTEKGLICEQKALDLVAKIKGIRIKKNVVRKTNSFITGEIDSSYNNNIIDTKVSYLIDSFPLFDTVNKNSLYDWQGDGYMDLWDKNEHEISYCLVDTPAHLLNNEIYSFLNKKNASDENLTEENIQDLVILVSKHIFTFKGLELFCDQSFINIDWFKEFYEIPLELRVKTFTNKYCEVRNKQFKSMIILARDYMNELYETTLKNTQI